MSELERDMNGGTTREIPPTGQSVYFWLATVMGLFAFAFGLYIVFAHWVLLRWRTPTYCILLVCLHTIYQWFRVRGYLENAKNRFIAAGSASGGDVGEDQLSFTVRTQSMVLLNSYGITLISLYAINLILESIEGR
jgi:hypothetical protein